MNVRETLTTEAPSAGPSRRGSHRLGVFRRCPRMYAYQFLLKLVPVREPEGRATGSLVHIALMWHYLAMLPPDALRQMGISLVDPIEAMRDAPRRLAHCFETARRIVLSYIDAYPEERFTVLDVEREFSVFVDGYEHTQRIDLVVQSHKDGLVYDFDHKTAKKDAERERGTWNHSVQFLSLDMFGHHVLAPTYDAPFGGVVLNGIGTKAKTTFDRSVVRIEPNMRPGLLRYISETNAQIDALERAGVEPWDYTQTFACRDRYGLCEFLPLCLHGKDALRMYEQAVDDATEMEI